MAEDGTLNLCPKDITICVTRGDTLPFAFNVKDDSDPAVAIDITGFSFLLTVDPDPNPTDATDNVFQLTGTITDGPNGVVQFQMTPAQADQTPGALFYDLQQTDTGGNIRTLAKGKFEFKQDVTK